MQKTLKTCRIKDVVFCINERANRKVSNMMHVDLCLVTFNLSLKIVKNGTQIKLGEAWL